MERKIMERAAQGQGPLVALVELAALLGPLQETMAAIMAAAAGPHLTLVVLTGRALALAVDTARKLIHLADLRQVAH